MDKNNYTLSDRTVKDNITIIPNALTKVGLITGYTFTWKQHNPPEGYEVTMLGDDTGLIAQEVEQLGLPGISTTRNGLKNVSDTDYMQRIVECTKCEKLVDNNICSMCGCYIPTKARWEVSECPINKWKK